jgi:kynurenine formamidase
MTDRTADTASLSAAEFRTLYERIRTRSPWGPADRRGGLNNITPSIVRAATNEVRLGRTVSLAAPIENEVSADNPEPANHEMRGGMREDVRSGRLQFALDALGLNIHGNADTHLDALCHVIYERKLYNDIPADTITEAGPAELSVDLARNGIVGRGVLLDVPKIRDRPWLEPGDHVTTQDLLATERAEGVTVGQGDILLVRVGHRRRRNEVGPWDAAEQRAGLHPTVSEFLVDRRVAMLGSDGNNDSAPSKAEGIAFPIHVLAIQALGLHLLDYLQLEDLTSICEETGKWSFLCVIAPLRLPNGTGSPVNPIALM